MIYQYLRIIRMFFFSRMLFLDPETNTQASKHQTRTKCVSILSYKSINPQSHPTSKSPTIVTSPLFAHQTPSIERQSSVSPTLFSSGGIRILGKQHKHQQLRFVKRSGHSRNSECSDERQDLQLITSQCVCLCRLRAVNAICLLRLRLAQSFNHFWYIVYDVNPLRVSTMYPSITFNWPSFASDTHHCGRGLSYTCGVGPTAMNLIRSHRPGDLHSNRYSNESEFLTHPNNCLEKHGDAPSKETAPQWLEWSMAKRCLGVTKWMFWAEETLTVKFGLRPGRIRLK